VIAVALLLGVLAALVQAAVVPTFYLDAWAAPVPACALIAGWAAARRPEETWGIAVAGAVVLGVVSVERSGWFLLAMLPTVGVAMLLTEVSPNNRGFSVRVTRATATAVAGTLAYIATLALASASGDLLLEETPGLVIAALGTGLLAAVVLVAMLPFRRRTEGLFV
jgi:hypothetical protein